MEIKSKEIVLVDLDKIIFNPKNPNVHSDEQIERLCKLIKNTGFRSPVIISKQSGFLIVGHGRCLSAAKLGMKQVPAIFEDFENDADEYAYMCADNAIASWAQLDLGKINLDFVNFGPFDLDMLGIKDFTINPTIIDLPELKEGNPDYQQVTFILSNEQKDILDSAMEKAKLEEDFSDEINPNRNGNIITAILRKYVNS